MPPKWDTVLEVIFSGFPGGVGNPSEWKVGGKYVVSGP